MTGAEVIDLARDALWTLIKISGPIMIVGLTVGVTIALFQALTQLQEMTLTFVPKIVVIMFAIGVTLPYMGEVMNSFMLRIMDRVISSGG